MPADSHQGQSHKSPTINHLPPIHVVLALLLVPCMVQPTLSTATAQTKTTHMLFKRQLLCDSKKMAMLIHEGMVSLLLLLQPSHCCLGLASLLF